MNKDSKNQFANEKNGDSSYSISETILKKASKRLLCSIKYIYSKNAPIKLNNRYGTNNLLVEPIRVCFNDSFLKNMPLLKKNHDIKKLKNSLIYGKGAKLSISQYGAK